MRILKLRVFECGSFVSARFVSLFSTYSTTMGDADKFTKLPEFAKPLVYDIKLAPCLKSFTFNGVSSVTLNVRGGFFEFEFLKRFLGFFDIHV